MFEHSKPIEGAKKAKSSKIRPNLKKEATERYKVKHEHEAKILSFRIIHHNTLGRGGTNGMVFVVLEISIKCLEMQSS